MKTSGGFTALLGAISLWTSSALAQGDMAAYECASSCISNVDGTNCTQAQFSCLCQSQVYLERLNDCVYNACNKTEEDGTFSAIAQLCAVLGIPLTVEPEAMASMLTSDQVLTTQGAASASSPGDTTTAADMSPTPASNSALSSIAQATSSAVAAATSNAAMAAMKQASTGRPGCLTLWLLTCAGGLMGVL